MDSRIICLNSADAKKLNGDYNSNLYFDIPNIVDETHLISHIEVALEDATIPVSWYLISSFSSSSNLSNQIIQSIPVDMPAFHQITYINKASHYGRLKNRYINNIDIQLFDEYGRYIEMNGIEFNLSFNIKIYRKYNVSHDIINQLTSKNEDSKKDLVDEKNSEDPDLELLLQK
jgi:hypothetical protein